MGWVSGTQLGGDVCGSKEKMKRIGHLYDKIISVENLRLADEKARRGKLRTYGVRHHDRNREANIQALHEALLTKTFKTSPYEVFTIYEPKEYKQRICSWLGWAKHSNSKHLLQTIIPKDYASIL